MYSRFVGYVCWCLEKKPLCCFLPSPLSACAVNGQFDNAESDSVRRGSLFIHQINTQGEELIFLIVSVTANLFVILYTNSREKNKFFSLYLGNNYVII
jgi:hypothetical protein